MRLVKRVILPPEVLLSRSGPREPLWFVAFTCWCRQAVWSMRRLDGRVPCYDSCFLLCYTTAYPTVPNPRLIGKAEPSVAGAYLPAAYYGWFCIFRDIGPLNRHCPPYSFLPIFGRTFLTEGGTG